MSGFEKILCDNKSSLELFAKNESHLILKDYLSSISRELKIEKRVENQLLIVVDEVFSNIVKYANVEGGSIVKIDIYFDEKEMSLELKFTDKGIAYNPLEAENPDVNAPIEERKIGGLGIFIVKKIMDKLAYSRENDSNILSLKKFLVG